MKLYTRFNTGAVFVWPALCIGNRVGEPMWIELAWLGLAVGVTL